MRTVIIGVGNPLRADDAVGLHVAQAVRARLAGGGGGDMGGCDVDELWAGGLGLVEAMCGYDRAIVVDAMQAEEGLAPGTVRRLDLDALGPCRSVTCVHDTSLATALVLARSAGEPLPSRISVFGIQVADTSAIAERLSAPVAAAIPRAVDAIFEELGGLRSGQ